MYLHHLPSPCRLVTYLHHHHLPSSPCQPSLPTFIIYLHHFALITYLHHLPLLPTFIAYLYPPTFFITYLDHLSASSTFITYLHHFTFITCLHCLPLSPPFIYHLPSSSLTFIIHLSSLIC